MVYDDDKKIVGIIHAGWKGAYKGILKRVINFLYKKGCKKKNIITPYIVRIKRFII